MKLSQLIEHMQKLQTEHGDVEFLFDWGADADKLEENDITMDYNEYTKTNILRFY